ncbi:zeta toxin family protein [Sinorhizobium chiapasense]|uniref:Zeta toxin family protein n=1 Tax=Sinorhizobium chiapasense TaxID=501572 RepID=A0ABZ2BFI4_9HYPH
MTGETAQGTLSPENNESIFRKEILPDYLPEDLGRATRPRLVLIGGQPGAGKTAVLIAGHSELAQSGPTIRIVGDDLRSYHPEFLAYQRQDPETASRFTQMDAGRWTEKLLAAAAERQVNIVFETTMRTPENVARVVRVAREAGYEVEARAVAVNPRVSWQGNLFRFEEMLSAGAAARIPPQHVHDAAVGGLRVSLEKLEGERLVDRVQVLTRGGTVLYDNDLQDGEWSRSPRARLALEQEQSRPLTRSELQRFADDWSHVLSRMAERNAPADRIAQVETRAAEDVRLLLAERREADGKEGRGQGRTVLQRSADGLKLFVELYDNAVRDGERRPIGNLDAHAAGRLTQTYMALRLVEAARDLGLLPEDAKIVTTRALVQDKRATHEFPAAHRLPADLSVEGPDGTSRRLTEHFGVELNRIAIDREAFSRTDRLSRLANVADSWLKAAGMRKTLARAANAVADGSMTADEAMSRIVEPGYAAAVLTARNKLDRNFAVMERMALTTTIVDSAENPMRGVADDLRLRTTDIGNRSRAKAIIEEIFAGTARHVRLDALDRQRADTFVRGIAENEQSLGVRLARQPDGRQDTTEPLMPARFLPDLTEGEIGDRLSASSRLADKRGEIENLSRLVFGNSQAVSSSLERITDAQSGAAASADVREGRLGELAGEGRRWLRGPSPERQTADAHMPRLAAALADYGLAVDFERHQIVMQHREERARQRVEVPRPSAELSAVLASDPDDRRRHIESDRGLKRELERLSVAMAKRFSGSDVATLKAGDIKGVVRKLGIDQMRTTELRKVLRQVTDLQQDLKPQSRERSRGEALTLTRR